MKTPQEIVLSKLERNKQLKRTKNPWLDLWQLSGEYVHMRRMDFTSSQAPGDFMVRDVFDSSAPQASKTSASSILSMLWPQSTKRFRLKMPDGLADTRENKEYYEKITAKLIAVMDNPKAGLPMALDEYMLDQVCFGTSAIEVLKSRETKVSYKAWGVKHISIGESNTGFVDTIYIEVRLPVHVIVKEYGIDKVSQKISDLYRKNKFDEEFDILIAVEPRILDEYEAPGKGVYGMPFSSCHMEMEQKHLLRESGFTEIPFKVGRFWKILGEIYGRCPSMDALPAVLEANAVWEAVTIAIEKSLDPPLGILDDGKLGGGEIDTSAGGVNVFNISGRAGEKNPVFPIYTVGEIKQSVNLLEKLAEDISNHFFIDRLLDFNNETRMTLGEANLRNRLRNSTLGSIFTRQIAEVFSPVIENTFNIMFDSGELGVIAGSVDHVIAVEINGENPIIIPEGVAKLMLSGRDVYQIEYFTPALRIMQAEEADGILRTWQMALEIKSAGVENVVDSLDADISIRRFSDIAGAPTEIKRAAKDVETIRDERDKVAQEQREIEMMKMAAEGARNIGQSGLVPVRQPQKMAA